VALLRSYREAGVEERRQVKWPLWGTMIAVGARIILYIVGTTIGFVLTFRNDLALPDFWMMAPEALAKVLYLLIPLSFAIAIFKYRLMNIDIIIRRTVLYSILSAIVFGVYIALVAGVGSLVVHFTAVKNQTMIIGSTIIVGLIAIPLRNRLQRIVDRNLFRERRDYALALRNISSATGVGDLHAFLKKAAEEVQQAVQNRFVLLALRSETHYVAAAKVGIADEVLGTLQIPVAEVSDSAPEQTPALRRLGTTLAMPLRAHGDLLGLIALGARLSDQEFVPDDIQFLAAAAQQIALGIENARLRTEEADFAQARAMQQILLPTHFPRLDGFGISGMWQPARSVGGDYFDTIALSDDKVAVCIADVAGKGMPAALLMANLQAAVKATAGPDVDPAQLCDKVKRVVASNLAGGTFITFFYGVVDASTRTFAYSNAGHNPPILARADGSVVRLTAGGPALCRLFIADRHASESVSLQPGDRLVLFTDGASEARRGDEELGDERLVSLVTNNRHLSAEALQNTIAHEVAAFSGGSLDDDLTLVVVAAQ
jgi:sigma-B regulation protein RsbU (phosphoserine phosphatase)